MRNKSTFSVLMAGLLLIAAWCGTARADYGPWSDWVVLTDGVQNACKASFRRSSDEVEVRVYNGYTLNVNITLRYRVVNKTDGSANSGTISVTNLPPGQIYMSGTTQIHGKNATTTAYSVPVDSYTIDLPLASNPNGTKYQIYPHNERAKQEASGASHEDLARSYLQQARKLRQQADQMRQVYLQNQRAQAAQRQQQQERQRQIDAEKRRIQNQAQRVAEQGARNAQNTADNINQVFQNAQDTQADADRAREQLRQQARAEREAAENDKIKGMIHMKDVYLNSAIHYDAMAEGFEKDATLNRRMADQNPRSPMHSTYIMQATTDDINATLSRSSARKERRKADGIDDDIAKAREELANQNDDDQSGGNNAAQPTIDYVELGYSSYILRDYKSAMSYYLTAANTGNANAMYSVGSMYDRGQGVPQDYSQAMQWYKKAADSGDNNAMNNIGFMYDNGHGVPQDYAQAVQWYQKAANAGNSMAMFHAGVLYNNGHGVSQDYVQAMQWYQKAAAGGNANAMDNIGLLYYNGHGVTQDYTQAMQWYQKAAAQGDTNAMHNIGTLYYNGQGVAKDRDQAIQWYKKAAALGNQTSIDFLKKLGQ